MEERTTAISPPTKNALILKFGQIGDVILAVPAVYQLQQRADCGGAAQVLLLDQRCPRG